MNTPLRYGVFFANMETPNAVFCYEHDAVKWQEDCEMDDPYNTYTVKELVNGIWIIPAESQT